MHSYRGGNSSAWEKRLQILQTEHTMIKIHLVRPFFTAEIPQISPVSPVFQGVTEGVKADGMRLQLQFKYTFVKPWLVLLISPWWAKDNNNEVTEHLGHYVILLLRNLLVWEGFWNPLVKLNLPNEPSPGRTKSDVCQHGPRGCQGLSAHKSRCYQRELRTQSPLCNWAQL